MASVMTRAARAKATTTTRATHRVGLALRLDGRWFRVEPTAWQSFRLTASNGEVFVVAEAQGRHRCSCNAGRCVHRRALDRVGLTDDAYLT